MLNNLEDILNEIHSGLADHLAGRIRDAQKPGGEPLTAQEINAISKFLKDNHIEATPAAGTPFGGLVDSLPEYDDDNNKIINFGG